MKEQKRFEDEASEEELSSAQIRSRRKAARKKRILRNRLIFVGILLLIAGVIVFRVCVVAKTINVTNETPYSDEQLLAAMDEGKGTFLFSFNAESIAAKLKTVYPYVGSVEVKKHFPTTVDISFRVAERAFAFEKDGNFVYTDAGLRVLEITKTPDSSVLTVTGADIGKYEKGKTLDTEVFIYGDFISDLKDRADKNGLGVVTKIDLTKKYRIAFLLNGKTTVILGDFSDLDKKFDTLKYIVGENDPSVIATINVKNYKRGKYSLGSEIFSAEVVVEPSSAATESTEQPSVPDGTSYISDVEP